MKRDIIKKYRHQKLLSNISVITASLLFAFGINYFIFDGTSVGNNLKTSIVSVGGSESNADIYLSNRNGEIKLISNKPINNLKILSLSLTYNPENVSVMTINSAKGGINNISNTDGINSLIINFKEKSNIKPGDILLSIVTEKKSDLSEQLNIVNANFSDIDGENYQLTTSGVTF